MTKLPPSNLIQKIEDLLVAELSRVLRQHIPMVCEQLESMGERQTRPIDRQDLFSSSAMLRVKLASTSVVPELMAARKARTLRASLIEDPQRRSIVLTDEDDIETQILARRLAAAVVTEAGSTYPCYLHMLKGIAPASWQEEDLNPLAIKSISAIMVQAIHSPTDSALVKSSMRGLTVKEFAPEIVKTLGLLIERMHDEGVALEAGYESTRSEPLPQPPELSETKSAPPSAEVIGPTEKLSRNAANADQVNPQAEGTTPRGHTDAMGREIYSADLLGKSALARTSDLPRLGTAPLLQPVVEIERDAIAFAHSVGYMPYSRQARSSFFARNRTRLKEAKATAGQLATLDVVAAMFDYVVDETRLPEPVKPLFWRLQQPALALCLLDPSYLSEDARSLRNLIENFGAISTAFAGEISRGSELHRRLETVVRAVEIVTSSLQSRSAVMAAQVDKEYQKAAKSVGQLVEKVARERNALESTPQRNNRRDYAGRPSKERERNVTEAITRSLDERFSHFDVPDSVKEFLTTVWVRQLRTAALRDGEDSAEYKVAMQVVDDLLWSLNNDKRTASRKELAERIPPLIRLLTDGVKRVGAKEEEQKAFFDELFLVHLRKMSKRNKQKTTIQPGDVMIPRELVDRMDRPRSLTGQEGSDTPTKAQTNTRTNTGSNTRRLDSRRLDSTTGRLGALEASMMTVPKLDEQVTAIAMPSRTAGVPGTLREMEAMARKKSLGDSLNPISIPSFTAHSKPMPQIVKSRLPRDQSDTVARDSRIDLERDLVAPTHLRVVSRQELKENEEPGPTEPYIAEPTPVPTQTPARKIFAELGIDEPVTESPSDKAAANVRPDSEGSLTEPTGNAKDVEQAPAVHAPLEAKVQQDADKVLTEDDSAQLFEVMNAVDLSDCPPEQSSLDLAPQAALEAIVKGSWIRLTSRDGEVSMFKVAWLNQSRTLGLLVRFPDRRALSLRFGDLLKRLQEGHAALMNLPEM